MKTKKADLIYKVFFIVVGVILAGLLIAWLVNTYKDKKTEADAGTEKINSVTSQMADFDLTVYDGASIKGEALKELIQSLKEKKTQISVLVETLDTTKQNYIYSITPAPASGGSAVLGAEVTITPPLKKSDSGYITPTGNFTGEVIRNVNNEIVGLKFTQQR